MAAAKHGSEGRLRVAVLGAAGRVGRLVLAELIDRPEWELAAAWVRPGSAALGVDAGLLAGRPSRGMSATVLAPDAVGERIDAVVDFSTPGALVPALDLLGGLPLVSGTTGLSPDQQAALAAYARRAPLLQAANFSTGVAVLRHLVARVARILPDHDVEIVEAHHHHKKDAPSGTARALLQDVRAARGGDAPVVHGRSGQVGARPSGEIGMHALRAGDVVGEHAVWFAGDAERLVLSHSAHQRVMFARGALRAARWLAGRQPGHYQLAQVLGLSSDPI